ncbi:MAG TPA: AraC family transcriptional regulator [Hyalangium sp.]|nr:AraC family transcriptional regulator [Hyalangium sp.]
MKPATKASRQEAVLRVLVFIQERLDEELSLDRLARIARLAPFHFHRVFRAIVGESPGDHVKRLRLERAAHYLKMGEASVSSLASMGGYTSHEAFTRAFKGHFGVTPSQFREQHGRSTWARSPLPIHYSPEPRPVEFTPVRNPRDQACVEVLPPLCVAFVRHVGPYEQVGNVFERLLAWADRKGLLAESPLLLGAAHDDPGVSGGHVRFDACLLLPEPMAGEGEVGIQTLGGGEYAGVTHKGPFENLADTYGWQACDFIPRIARTPRKAASLELYLTHPLQTPPEELLTDVLIPLEPHAGDAKP